MSGNYYFKATQNFQVLLKLKRMYGGISKDSEDGDVDESQTLHCISSIFYWSLSKINNSNSELKTRTTDAFETKAQDNCQS